ncbi:uncharacterized protein LOC141686956 isoform X2 [Apium graveolens]|uniref:uncharacterized protein LOC141686956 isoform X2 n=1 Tax=Apium graveolens TaxID=4045 RepID=UPI003D7B968F
MPQELPGFYYDAEKNRYFPVKGPIPGSSRINSSASSSSSSNTARKASIEPKQAKVRKELKRATTKMLLSRELYGRVIISAKGKYNFREEYTKRLVSEPTIWRYSWTDGTSYRALEQVDVITSMQDGEVKTDLLLGGGMNGSLSFYVVDKDALEFDYGVRSTPDCAWPLDIKSKEAFVRSPGHLWRLDGASLDMFSSITCIKKFGKPGQRKILITTLGSATSGGSVSVLNLSDPLVLPSGYPMIGGNFNEITLFNRTVWTADCNSDGSQAFIGTDLGVTLVNIETGTQSWVCRCKSDIFSVQLDQSEKIALCGLRNGAIVTIDVRQRPDNFARLTRQRILLHSHKTRESLSGCNQNTSKDWFELKGQICQSGTISMPSSISCLASLKLYEQYFLASSMDGSIKLYDHRMVQRGAVQCYEGNVNSHTHIQLGVDPSEKFVMSGGEDNKLRLWSIRSGELLLEEKLMSSTPSVVCWQKEDICARDGYIDDNHSHLGEAWLGSRDGLFRMRWS